MRDINNIEFQRNYQTFINSPNAIQNTSNKQESLLNKSSKGLDFKTLLNNELEKGLVFSKHAKQRIDERNIEITPQLLQGISDAISKASKKGVRDALIISNNTAFIVNVPSGTVVTTMTGAELTNNVFTNIDGTVLI